MWIQQPDEDQLILEPEPRTVSPTFEVLDFRNLTQSIKYVSQINVPGWCHTSKWGETRLNGMVAPAVLKFSLSYFPW